MDERGNRGAEEQRRGRHPDDGLPPPGAPGGNRAAQVVEDAVGRFEVLDGAAQHTAQGELVQVGTGATGSVRAVARARSEEVRQLCEPGCSGGVVTPGTCLRRRRRTFRGSRGLGVRTRVRLHVRGVLRPVAHNSASSPVDPTLLRACVRGILRGSVRGFLPASLPALAPDHVWASITTRSAAIPRDP